MYIEKLKEMFAEVTMKKNASLIPVYYHPDFLLYTNDQTINYKEFLEDHELYYGTPIQYEIVYDDQTFLEQNDQVAGRMWITTRKTPQSPPHKMEILLIVQYRDGKIYRLWELTYPDWSKLPEFQQ